MFYVLGMNPPDPFPISDLLVQIIHGICGGKKADVKSADLSNTPMIVLQV